MYEMQTKNSWAHASFDADAEYFVKFYHASRSILPKWKRFAPAAITAFFSLSGCAIVFQILSAGKATGLNTSTVSWLPLVIVGFYLFGRAPKMFANAQLKATGGKSGRVVVEFRDDEIQVTRVGEGTSQLPWSVASGTKQTLNGLLILRNPKLVQFYIPDSAWEESGMKQLVMQRLARPTDTPPA